MTEADCRKFLRAMCRGQERLFLLQPIESRATALGIPDLFFRGKADGWIELKQAVITRGETRHAQGPAVRIRYRPKQLEWLRNYARLGGNSFLMLITSEGGEDVITLFYNDSILETYTLADLVSMPVMRARVKDMSFCLLYESLGNPLAL